MAKLKLNPEPTFKAKVGIPVPGAGKAPVEFVFKHRSREQIKEWMKAQAESDDQDTDTVMDFAVGWDLDDEFNAENVTKLCNNYPGAGFEILTAYLMELRGARAKN